MKVFSTSLGVVLVLLVLWDAFETVVLPRRVTRRYRLTRLFYGSTWHVWSLAISLLSRGRRQENYLSYFGPLSLILLLSIWASGLICGFALVNWASGLPLRATDGIIGFGTYLYLSGTTFFTLGLGDVAPASSLARALTVVESGLGFGFLALVLGYLPALNQSFSRREVNISLQDARAGSPPTAYEMLRRECSHDGVDALLRHLSEWERWSAELLESHLSYPVLAYFRSQHDNQSWLAALTVMLDTSAFVMVAVEGPCARQAQLTFAIARHAVADLSLIFNRAPQKAKHERLSSAELSELRKNLAESGLPLTRSKDVERELAELRAMYEPYVYSLSRYFRLRIPPWVSEAGHRDNWQTSAWEGRKGLRREGGTEETEEEHF